MIKQPFCKTCGDYMYNKEGYTYVVCHNCSEINTIFELDDNAVIIDYRVSMTIPRFSPNYIRMNALRSDYIEKSLYNKEIEDYTSTGDV